MQAATAKTDPEPLKYLCGSCGMGNEIAQEQIRCQYCGYRIFYKKRQRRLTHLLAR